MENKTYDTDKFASGLINDYLKMLWQYKVIPFKILEVGFLRCGFLLWLKDNFRLADIYGIDIKKSEINDDRLKLFQADQNDASLINEIAKTITKDSFYFDFIIDDGLHRQEETSNTFSVLWKYVKSGGWYIIEDWGAGYERPFYNNTEKFIASIITNKKYLGIEEMEIICKKGDISIAKFKKL